MATQDKDRAFRELLTSEEYRRKLRKLLNLGGGQTLPPRLVALAVELEGKLERREIELAKECPQLH
jgi:hypothetical protein